MRGGGKSGGMGDCNGDILHERISKKWLGSGDTCL